MPAKPLETIQMPVSPYSTENGLESKQKGFPARGLDGPPPVPHYQTRRATSCPLRGGLNTDPASMRPKPVTGTP